MAGDEELMTDIFAGDEFMVDVPLKRPLHDLFEGEGVATGVGIREVVKDELSELSKAAVLGISKDVFKVGEDVLNANCYKG